jgi:hypothetical protein
MQLKSATDRRKPIDLPKEIGRLYDKLVYWLYQRQSTDRALPLANRLAQLLPQGKQEIGSIFAEDCWSLIHEAKGDLAKAIEHRRKEVRLIRRLHRTSEKTASADYVFRQYGYDDLRDELTVLAMLYHDCGNLDRALKALREAKRLCQQHALEFDAEDLLDEYLEEKRKLQHQ